MTRFERNRHLVRPAVQRHQHLRATLRDVAIGLALYAVFCIGLALLG